MTRRAMLAHALAESHPCPPFPGPPPSRQTWIGRGGTIDFTADAEGESQAADALAAFFSEGQPMDRITLSSDAYGSFPTLDDDGTVIGYGVGKPDSLLITLRAMITRYGWTLPDVLPLITTTPARIYKFATKGQLAPGFDGDVLVLDRDYVPQYVFVRGRAVKTPTWIKKGMFEP